MSHPEPVLEPAARLFADETARVRLGVADGRAAFGLLQAGDVPRPAGTVEELTIEGGPSGTIRIRIVRPGDRTGRLPVICYLHGSSWVFGDVRTHDRLVRELATRARAAVVFVHYSQSPEARYPVAIEECYAALLWIAAEGAEHDLDPERIAIAGDSAGANLAAAVTLMAKQRSGPELAAQVLFYPVTDCAFDTGSYRQFAEGYWLRRDAMRWFWNQYTPDRAARAEVTAAPLRATAEQLAGLPPALIIVAEADVLRDEGEAYAAKLLAAGVPVTGVRYPGIIHDFVVIDALRDTHAAQAATAQAGRFLLDALS